MDSRRETQPVPGGGLATPGLPGARSEAGNESRHRGSPRIAQPVAARRSGASSSTAMAMIGLGIFGVMVLVAIFGPSPGPYDPLVIPGANETRRRSANDAPHFGTDEKGRDVFTMVSTARASRCHRRVPMLIAGVHRRRRRCHRRVLRRLGRQRPDAHRGQVLRHPVPVRHPGRRRSSSGRAGPLVILIFGLLSWPLIARLVRARCSRCARPTSWRPRGPWASHAAHHVPPHPAQRDGPGHRRHDPDHGLKSCWRRSSLTSTSASARTGQLGQRPLERPGGARSWATGGRRSSPAWRSRSP